MIYLNKGQVLADNPGMVVYDPTGYYNDGDSIVCASVGQPDEPVCRFEAKYVAYGGMVYSISDPDELLAQIVKMDPNSLFGKDGKQLAIDKAVEKIVLQKSTDDSSATSTDTTAPLTDDVSTTTPPLDVSTTTPPFDTSTTTPPFDVSTTTPPFDTSTTTSPVGTTTPPLDVSTTTPPFDTSTSTSSVGTGTTTPPLDVSTSTPPLDVSTTTSPLDTPADTTSTSSEIVAFAKSAIKRKIGRKLGL